MTTFTSQLQWRNATKGFDKTKQVSEGDLKIVLDAIRFAPTSFGLQPFHVNVVSDQPTKEKLTLAGWNQPQYKTASHVIVFSSLINVKERITQFLDLMSNGNPQIRDGLKGYEGMMRGALESRSSAELKAWADKQAYIALGFAMAACAELKIDSCPMEGFVPDQINAVMGFTGHQSVSVILPIGYRDAGIAVRPKVRFSERDLFTL